MKISNSLASLAVLTAAVTALPPAALVANGAMAKCRPAMMKKCGPKHGMNMHHHARRHHAMAKCGPKCGPKCAPKCGPKCAPK